MMGGRCRSGGGKLLGFILDKLAVERSLFWIIEVYIAGRSGSGSACVSSFSRLLAVNDAPRRQNEQEDLLQCHTSNSYV